MNNSFREYHGFAIFGVVVIIAILGSMAVGLSSLIATNQRTKVRQTYSNQAFYVAHASLEYSLRNIIALNASSIPQRQILGTDFSISTSNKIRTTTQYGQSGDMAANSVSIANPSYAPSCVYVLASSGTKTLDINGTAAVNASSCGINVNSTSSSAVKMVGNASLSAYFLNIAGNYSIGSNNTITTHTGNIGTGTSPVNDPLSYLDVPDYTSCTYTSHSVTGSGNTILDPGVYCNGLSITGSGTVTLNPGKYIIDGGTFSAAGSANVIGNGVTIFLNKKLKSSFANISLTGTGSRQFTAPINDPDGYSGIAIFQSRNATSGTNTITGSGSLDITGAIYLPNQTLSFGGTSSSSRCTLLVVNQLAFSGTANIGCNAGDLSGLIP